MSSKCYRNSTFGCEVNVNWKEKQWNIDFDFYLLQGNQTYSRNVPDHDLRK